jgi:glycosyltransferase involved in cell wall biosynthesis
VSPFLSAVIPAYNEDQNLRACVQALREQLGGLSSPQEGASTGLEIIIVNDASLDHTAALAEALAQEVPGLRQSTTRKT